MSQETSYTTEEIAGLLKISKLKVYDLIKKGELPSYRVGKQMRVDASDLEAYKQHSRNGNAAGKNTGASPASNVPISSLSGLSPAASRPAESQQPGKQARNIVITGQDMSLDILATYLERSLPSDRPLRSYAGSLDSLIAMYNGESDIVSTHLLDGDTGEYNLPYIRRLLVGFPYIVVHMLTRSAGFYVKQGNPKELAGWADLRQEGLTLVNRERGSGARVLLDEQLRLQGISPGNIQGYGNVENSHLAVAGKVARGEADVGIGIEKAAKIVDGIEFIPLIQESYDLVMLKNPENMGWIQSVIDILHSSDFRSELGSIYGYDLSASGNVLYET
ncbi:substrate-binding domain-containing protein [Paenibacillus sp. sgz500958]|uniref:substrate-binding domain-containing protein n=1 Tax=Paenibacillus sp. sgz500958 TaxID=3242475 RepID=UPI0036D2ADF2